jgi:DNA helicase-2/ATP-dependent DNA helicase PcrA
LIRQELATWHSSTCGIAALSFTRVGGEEIRKAVGYELVHPHFVGTIDAFVFRYVVRPFLQKCFPSFSAPRLIPGEWGAEHWGRCSRFQRAIVVNGINLLGCVFIGEENGKAMVAHKPHPAQPLRPIYDPHLTQVKTAKKQVWQRSGCLTHSDAALLASKILEHGTSGSVVNAEIVRRFPLIIVDELQDTGYFLGKTIYRLLGDASARGVLVGDPDQAIYEFNGARPDLFGHFESIEGAVVLPLSNSRRCAPGVATVASCLKDSEGSIGPANGKTGQAFLLRYSNMATDILRIVDAVTKIHNSASIKVIARQSATIQALIGRSAKPLPKLGCTPLNHLHRAVTLFRQGRQVAALAAARAAIDSAIFQHEGVDTAELEDRGIGPTRWKRLAVDCLLCANAKTVTTSLYDWQIEVGEILDTKIVEFGLAESLQFAAGRLKPKKLGEWNCACSDYIPQVCTRAVVTPRVPINTVHGVKGETHDVTIFVCPDTTRADRCPSVVWWSADEQIREERRIAYVAMTRTQGDLIVCVSEACYHRLCTSRKAFVENFECMSVDEYVTMSNRDRPEGGHVAVADKL